MKQLKDIEPNSRFMFRGVKYQKLSYHSGRCFSLELEDRRYVIPFLPSLSVKPVVRCKA